VTALRVADFRRLWLAGLISDTGDWLLLATLPIVVFQITGSTLGTATAFLIELVPPVVLAPIAGAVADRFDRRRTLIVVSLAQAAALVPLPFVAHGHAALPWIYAVIAAQSALATLFDPTKNALLPSLVDADRLVSANSLVGLNQNIGRLVGAPLGGVLLLAGGGLGAIAVIDAATFLAAVALISRLSRVRTSSTPSAAAPPPPPPRDPATDGWRTALAPRTIRGALATLFTTSVAQGLFVVLYVVFVSRALHGNAAEIGLLRGVQAIGAIGAGLLLATGRPRTAPARLATIGMAVFGLLDLAIWNTPRLTHAEPLYILLFVLVGAPGVAINTGLITVVQKVTADGQRGRVFAAAGVVASFGQAAGMIIGGLLGDPIGVVPVLNVQAALYLVGAVVAGCTLGLGRRPRHAPPTKPTPDLAIPSQSQDQIPSST
jgi:MFS family permease